MPSTINCANWLRLALSNGISPQTAEHGRASNSSSESTRESTPRLYRTEEQVFAAVGHKIPPLDSLPGCSRHEISPHNFRED